MTETNFIKKFINKIITSMESNENQKIPKNIGTILHNIIYDKEIYKHKSGARSDKVLLIYPLIAFSIIILSIIVNIKSLYIKMDKQVKTSTTSAINTTAANTTAANTTAANTTAANTTAANTTAANTTAANTTAANTTIANTTAANTTAANTTAANTTAAETAPAETTPAETIPAETAPFTNTNAFKIPKNLYLDPESVYNNELLNKQESRERINIILTMLSILSLIVLIGSKHDLNAKEHHWDTLFYISLVIFNLALFIKLNTFKFNIDNEKITNQVGNILGGISGGVAIISLLGIGYYYAL